MTRKTRRGLIILLTAVLTAVLFACFSAAIYAGATDGKQARIGAACYTTLQEAINAAQSGQTVKLIGDVKIPSALQINCNINLDLNGKKLTGPNTGNNDGSDYIFDVKSSGITLNVIGEGSIHVYSNWISTQEGMVRLPAGSTFNLKGSFDGITLTGEGCVYIAPTDGFVNVSNVKAYTPKDGTQTTYGLFNSRSRVVATYDRVVVYKTASPTDSTIPSMTDSSFHFYDYAQTTLTNCYIDSARKGFTVRHAASADNTAAEGRVYLTITNCTVKATVARYDTEDGSVGWARKLDANGNQIGWRLEGEKNSAVAAYINTTDDIAPVGKVLIDTSTFVAAWRVFVQDGAVCPVEQLKHNIEVRNSTLTADASTCGVPLTPELITKLTNARKESDGATLAAKYTYDTDRSYMIPSENSVVRGRGAKFYFNNCDMYGIAGLLWASDDKDTENEAGDAADYFLLEDTVRFNCQIQKNCNFTSVQYGTQDNYIIAPIYDDLTYKYGIVSLHDALWSTGTGTAEYSIRYNYYGTDNTTVQEARDGLTTTTGRSPIKVTSMANSSSSPSKDGGYIKLHVAKPSNTYYTASGKPGYVDADTIKTVVPSYFIVHGRRTNDGASEAVDRTFIYDKRGKAKFRYFAMEIHFKTDSTFLSNGSNFTFRAAFENAELAEHNSMLRFYEASGGVYLRTTTQKNANTATSLLYEVNKSKGQWYRLTIVLELSDTTGDRRYSKSGSTYTLSENGTYIKNQGGSFVDTGTTGAHSSVHYYIDGTHVGTDNNVLPAGTEAISGFRYNVSTDARLDYGESICFDSYSVRTSNQLYINLANFVSVSTKQRSSELDAVASPDVVGALKYFKDTESSTMADQNNPNQKYSALRLTDEGDYIKFEIQNPTASSTAYGNKHSTDGGKTVTIPSGLDSYLLMRGTTSSQLLRLYNDAGTTPQYQKVIFEVDIKTDSNFIRNGSVLTFRFSNGGSNPIKNFMSLYFYEDLDEAANSYKTYVRTYEQVVDRGTNNEYPYGQGGLLLVKDGTWQTITMVLNLFSDYKDNYVDFYLVGMHIGRVGGGDGVNLFAEVPRYYDALRFNVAVDQTYGIGDNICFRDYALYTYKDEEAIIKQMENNQTILRSSALDAAMFSNPANLGGAAKYFSAADKVSGSDAELLSDSKLSSAHLSDEGSFLKFQIQDPINSDTSFGNKHSTDGGVTVDVPAGLDSHLLIRGTYKEAGVDKVGDITLYNSSGKNPAYDIMVFEIDIKTDLKYIGNGSYITIRCEDGKENLVTTKVSAYFDTVGSDVYLRTHSQSAAGSGGVKLANTSWNRLKFVVYLEDSYDKAYADLYINSSHVGTQRNIFFAVPVLYDALRFNLVPDKNYAIGSNICFKNYTVGTYNYKTQGTEYYFGSTFLNPPAPADPSTNMGAYANYIVTPEGKMYGKYYTNTTAAINDNTTNYSTVDLIKSESGTAINYPVRIKQTGSATFKNYTVKETLGYTASGGVYTFSDLYTSVIGMNEYDAYGGTYISYPTELLWNQPIKTQYRNKYIPSATAGDDTLYAPVAWSGTSDGAEPYQTTGPVGEKELYAVYKTIVYVVWNNGGTQELENATKYSVDQTQFASDFNSLQSGGKIQLRENVTLTSDTQMPINSKTLTLDLYGARLAVIRCASEDNGKKIFHFNNTSAAEASTMNVLSSLPGGEIFAGIDLSTLSGAIFHMGDGPHSEGNVVNILGGNVGLFSSCIADIRGKNNTVNAVNGGRFVKSGSDYSGLFVVRPLSENTRLNFKGVDFGTMYIGPFFNVNTESAVVNIEDSNLVSLTEYTYLANKMGASSTYSYVDLSGVTQTVNVPAFSGTINLSGVRTNCVLACIGVDDEGASFSGKINLNGNNHTSAVVNKNSNGVKADYFINHSGITYNGKAFENAKFGRVNELLKFRYSGDNIITVPFNNATSNLNSRTFVLDDILEVVTLADGETTVRWINYTEDPSLATSGMISPAKNDNASIEKGEGSPISIEQTNLDYAREGVYKFIWKISGIERTESLSLANPRYPISLDSDRTVCVMKTKSDFSLKSNLSITDNFTYNIYVPASVVSFKEGGEVIYKTESKSFIPTLKPVWGADGKVANHVYYEYDGKEYYRIAIEDISVFNADDEIKFSIVIPVAAPDAFQKQHTAKWTYSVPKYATKVIDNKDDPTEAKQMVTDMLAYIKAAYLYQGKAAPERVAAALNAALAAGFTPSEFAPKNTAKTPEGISQYITGVTVNISMPSTRFRFTFAPTLSAMIRFSYASAKGTLVENFIYVENGIVTEINGIATSDGLDFYELESKVYDFNADIVIGVDGNGDDLTYDPVTDFITEFNSLSYIQYVEALENSDENAAKKSALSLIKTLYSYAESAKKYQLECVLKKS